MTVISVTLIIITIVTLSWEVINSSPSELLHTWIYKMITREKNHILQMQKLNTLIHNLGRRGRLKLFSWPPVSTWCSATEFTAGGLQVVETELT